MDTTGWTVISQTNECHKYWIVMNDKGEYVAYVSYLNNGKLAFSWRRHDMWQLRIRDIEPLVKATIE